MSTKTRRDKGISRKPTRSVDGHKRITVTLQFRFTETELRDFMNWCEKNETTVQDFLHNKGMDGYYWKEENEEKET